MTVMDKRVAYHQAKHFILNQEAIAYTKVLIFLCVVYLSTVHKRDNFVKG